MLICSSLNIPATEEHLQGLFVIDRREVRQVVYFMACAACGCIHRLEFNSAEEENEWFKHRAS